MGYILITEPEGIAVRYTLYSVLEEERSDFFAV